ncbi:Mu transposase C-terminal domain-containing protein [Bacillus tianshenii]|uniref:Mu transposase C-terminal domain-containing protein n=1 Tax=Sutcliffiella tianshenii TaxID=1463404 RepID=UPI001CD280BB|nr:Mu transposase C-terminal domain-containing protein [Bacillus tianshenii]MCA1322149.1 Mu transposase C-terminal domain-containing protein [Bacillus tianshenii]
MSAYYFNVGSKFQINENEYLVRRDLGLDYEVENMNYKKIEIRRKEDLLKLWSEGQLLFRINPDDEKFIRVQNLDDLDSDKKEKALERFKVLKPVIEGEILPSEIKNYLQEVGIKKSTFYDWKKRWDRTGDLRSLISFKRGPKAARLNGSLLKIVKEVIEEFLYSDGKTTIEDMYSEITLRIEEENINLVEEDKLSYVSRSTIRRCKERIIDIYKLDKEKYGAVLAKLKREGTKEEVVVQRPLQRVEIDWTPVDVMLIDPIDLKPKRPTLIYAIDKYSGYPMGFFVTFKPIDSKALKQCLIHLIMPKAYLKELYPLVENDWEAHGIPHTIVVDNASVNDSYEFEDACFQVGVKEVQFCKIDAGYQKGTVERAFRRLNSLYIHNLKGTTFSNFIEKGRYDSAKNACITMQGFIYMSHIAMVDIVSHTFDSRRGDSPHNIWARGIEENKRLKMQLPRSIESLKILLAGGSELRKVQQQGVVIENEYYTSPDLMDLRYTMEKLKKLDETVRVRFDLSDMRVVYVYDPINNNYLVARATSLARKNINTAFPVPYVALELDSKAKVKIKKSFDPTARAKAKRKIMLIQDEDAKKTKKWRKGKEKEQIIDSTFITAGVLNTETNIPLPINNDKILILKEEKKSNVGQTKRNQSSKDRSTINHSYMEFEDTEIDDLPNWGVTLKNMKEGNDL